MWLPPLASTIPSLVTNLSATVGGRDFCDRGSLTVCLTVIGAVIYCMRDDGDQGSVSGAGRAEAPRGGGEEAVRTPPAASARPTLGQVTEASLRFDGAEAVSFERRLVDLGIALPPALEAPGHYVTAYVHGDLAESAGHLPFKDHEILSAGRLGAEIDVPAGVEAARVATLNALASLRAALGSLDRIRRVIKVRGYVSSIPEFAEHHLVTNGASDLILSIFGDEAGGHIRSTVGISSLPFRAPVEIELGCLIHPQGT
jgi:enamine deaminase RidA (YjgF/YER057c/UK114 family)